MARLLLPVLVKINQTASYRQNVVSTSGFAPKPTPSKIKYLPARVPCVFRRHCSTWAKLADVVSSRAIYGIAAEFDLGDLISRSANLIVEAISPLLSSIPDARFPDPDGTAFMLAALLGGTVRVVMEAGSSEEDLKRLRQELPRACFGYLKMAV